MARAIVAGAGIGGLAAAVSLRRAGFEVSVLERAPKPPEEGAGIWLWRNGLRALDDLGLADEVAARGEPHASSLIADHAGRAIVRAQIVDEEGNVAPSVAILRPELRAAIASALEPGTIEHGVAVQGFQQDESGVRIAIEGGGQRFADLLVAAEGVGSPTRRLMDGTLPRDGGFEAWRAVLPRAAAEQIGPVPVGAMWGDRARFGFMSVGGGRLNWFAAVHGRSPSDSTPIAALAWLRRRFADWPTFVSEAISATDPETVDRRRVPILPPARMMHDGRVALLGDASHTVPPTLGQGGCMALEDAVVLGVCLAGRSGRAEITDALARYARLRLQRRSAVDRRVRWIETIAWLQSPWARALRNEVLRAVPRAWSRQGLRHLTWFEPPAFDGEEQSDA